MENIGEALCVYNEVNSVYSKEDSSNRVQPLYRSLQRPLTKQSKKLAKEGKVIQI